MKKKVTFMITGSVVLLFMTLISCENDISTTTDSVVDVNAKVNSTAKIAAITYGITPSVGNYSPNSVSTTTLSGSCGKYTGGIIRAQVISQSGANFVIRISKQNGGTFSVAGTAKIKAGSVCGNLAGSTNYSLLNKFIDVTITATFNQGITHFYPVVESATGGTKYYAEPVMVYTLPTYATGPYYDGMLLATVNGVSLYASDSDLQNSNSYNQCTNFCNRYYLQVYGMNIVNSGTEGGSATTWFNKASAKNLVAYANNGPVGPRIGDILCLSGGGGLGHVGIITEISSNEVKVANQNGGPNTLYPIGWTLARTGNKLTNPKNYLVQGWLRKP